MDLLRAVSEEHESAGFASDPVFREGRPVGVASALDLLPLVRDE